MPAMRAATSENYINIVKTSPCKQVQEEAKIKQISPLLCNNMFLSVKQIESAPSEWVIICVICVIYILCVFFSSSSLFLREDLVLMTFRGGLGAVKF